MLINDNFVFIHIPKTAGTSIQTALAPYVGKALRKYRDPTFPDHITLKELNSMKNTNAIFSFAFVRNPWEWAQSLYHYVIQHGEKRRWSHLLQRYNDMGLNDWIVFGEMEEWIVTYTNWHRKNRMYQLSDWITSNISFVGRFENLQSDFDFICNRLNVHCTLPRTVISKHPHYSQEYKKNGVKKIRTLFSKDIQNFKYQYVRN